MRNITFKITTDNQKPLKDGTYHLKLRLKTPRKHIHRSGVHVKVEHWDDSYGNIKQEFVDLYPQEKKFIDAIHSRVGQIRQPLQKQEMGITTAFDILLGKQVKSGSILEFTEQFKPNAKIQQETINKHIANIKAINTGLDRNGLQQYVPLEFSHLQDESCIDNIATVIKTQMGLKNNTQSGYMKTLNWVCKNSKQNLVNPFTHYGYMVTEKPSGKNEPISGVDLQLGFNKINTMHQFEAYCFWLYSFCLMGLDGRDIAGLSENDIITKGYKKGDIKDYIPESDILGNKDYIKPLHVNIKRGKTRRGATDSGVDATFQINLFPTLIVLELLKHAIKHNQDGRAYTGNDLLRLYDFDIDTEDGMKKWSSIRNTYTSQMHDNAGTTTQQARHTVTSVAQKIGLNAKQQDALLNHKDASVLANYTDKAELQIDKDVSQIHVFQHYGIIEIVKNLLTFFKDRTEIIENKEIPFVPDNIMFQKINKRRVQRLHRHQMFQINKLTNFSREKEQQYQSLMKEMLDGKAKLVNGEMVRVPILEKDYPQVLRDLIAERKDICTVKPDFIKGIFDKQLLDQIEFTNDLDLDTRKNVKVIDLKTG